MSLRNLLVEDCRKSLIKCKNLSHPIDRQRQLSNLNRLGKFGTEKAIVNPNLCRSLFVTPAKHWDKRLILPSVSKLRGTKDSL